MGRQEKEEKPDECGWYVFFRRHKEDELVFQNRQRGSECQGRRNNLVRRIEAPGEDVAGRNEVRERELTSDDMIARGQHGRLGAVVHAELVERVPPGL